jgi:DNA-binding transcriptional ArsR family regulator
METITTAPYEAATSLKAKLFRGLADASRLTVLEALREGPRSVSDVVERTGLSQPTVSMHLTCLWECGLIERERQGRFVYYRVEDPRVVVLLEAGDGLLVRVGDQVHVCTRYEA